MAAEQEVPDCTDTQNKQIPLPITTSGIALVKMEAINDVDTDHISCKTCNWIGKKNALLKHLRMKPGCKSLYDLKKINIEQAKLKKMIKQQDNALNYARKKEFNKQDYQKRKEEGLAYQRNYDEKNREAKRKYDQEYQRIIMRITGNIKETITKNIEKRS